MKTHTYMDNGVERTILAGWLLGWLTGSLFMTYCNDFIYLFLLLCILLFMSCLCLPMLAHVDGPGFQSRDKKHEVCLDYVERTRHVETSSDKESGYAFLSSHPEFVRENDCGADSRYRSVENASERHKFSQNTRLQPDVFT
ncbi:hypothetical protein B0T24DRAFT_254164 [Lasiosphaeria ovina]|uniref:Uncharacterized protein n=1 Tax=Lasiosphaeria ovina TaxID=92902 RepID=A0AAE0KBW9_9PEZI|nr:hypothetical protein B0T24DRAFT_254164 [Lasiosphaeria ovina]